MEKYVIIGGVAGGMSAAARLRRLSENAQIIVFEKGEYISYANCGLPYYLGNTITDRQELLVQTPRQFKARFNVEIRINCHVTAIHRQEKQVEVINLTNGTQSREDYDKLILSPGAEPVKPPIPGISGKNIFTLRNIPDMDNIHQFIAEKKPATAVVAGGGYIGLEVAENLQHRGIKVTIIEALPQVVNILDFEMAAIIHHHLREKGIELRLADKVQAFQQTDSGTSINLASGKVIETGLVILSIGVKPNTELAQMAGLKSGLKGGIAVNSHLQTSDPEIYAIGDAIEVYNPILQTMSPIPLAGPASKQGRIVADNIVTGNTVEYKGTIGTSVLKVFDLSVAVTGAGEKALQQAGIEYLCTIVHPSHHAGYYPGAEAMALKLLFAPGSGRILGAQGVGRKGVAKRIDVISAFIQMQGTVDDLVKFEHSYAPPFSSARDPVNMAGFTAQNILQSRVKTLNWQELEHLSPDCLLLDVRTADEYTTGTLPGAVNIPVDNLRHRLKELDPNRQVIIFCQVGLRGYLAARILMQHGFQNVFNLSGGYLTYQYLNR